IGLAGVAGDADHRGDADDAARAALHHPLHRRAGQAEIAFQVDLDDGLEVLVLHPHQQAVLGDAGVGDQDVQRRAGGFFSPRHQAIDRGRVRQVGGGVMGALAQLLGEIGQHGFARARQHDSRALGVQGARDGPADAAGGAGHQGDFAGKVEHLISPKWRVVSGEWREKAMTVGEILATRHSPLVTALANASNSSAVFSARASASGAMRLAMPVRTLPAPTSTKRVTPPSEAIHSMLSRQRTRPVTCSTSRRRRTSGSVSGRAVTLATTGVEGATILASARAAAISSAAGCISGQWNGAETFSGMARAPSSLAFSMARST